MPELGGVMRGRTFELRRDRRHSAGTAGKITAKAWQRAGGLPLGNASSEGAGLSARRVMVRLAQACGYFHSVVRPEVSSAEASHAPSRH